MMWTPKWYTETEGEDARRWQWPTWAIETRDLCEFPRKVDKRGGLVVLLDGHKAVHSLWDDGTRWDAVNNFTLWMHQPVQSFTGFNRIGEKEARPFYRYKSRKVEAFVTESARKRALLHAAQ